MLKGAGLLPHSSGHIIQRMTTRVEKVSFFLERVVSRGPDIYLPILINIMEKDDDLVLISLAKDMKNYMVTGNILVCIMTLSKLSTYIYVHIH